MIKMFAELKCKTHPKYMAQRQPKSCAVCQRIYDIVCDVQLLSKRYGIMWGNTWPKS